VSTQPDSFCHLCRYTPKLTNIAELNDWNDFSQEFTDIKAIVPFLNRLQSYVAAAGGHSEHFV